MANTLPFLAQKFNGEIWRLEIDGDTDTIFAEIRSSANKQVLFGSISLLTGQTYFVDKVMPEPWLTGIEAANNGVLLLHGYESSSSPVHKGVMAIDGKSGETLWANYTYAFDHLAVNGPVLFNTQTQPKKLFIADIKTGATVRPYNRAIDTELMTDITYPEVLPTAHLNETAITLTPYGNSIHYLECDNLRIVSLHSLEKGNLQQHLFLLNETGIVYEDILATGIQKLQPEAFIVHKNYLIYIKNKSELKAIKL